MSLFKRHEVRYMQDKNTFFITSGGTYIVGEDKTICIKKAGFKIEPDRRFDDIDGAPVKCIWDYA